MQPTNLPKNMPSFYTEQKPTFQREMRMNPGAMGDLPTATMPQMYGFPLTYNKFLPTFPTDPFMAPPQYMFPYQPFYALIPYQQKMFPGQQYSNVMQKPRYFQNVPQRKFQGQRTIPQMPFPTESSDDDSSIISEFVLPGDNVLMDDAGNETKATSGMQVSGGEKHTQADNIKQTTEKGQSAPVETAPVPQQIQQKTSSKTLRPPFPRFRQIPQTHRVHQRPLYENGDRQCKTHRHVQPTLQMHKPRSAVEKQQKPAAQRNPEPKVALADQPIAMIKSLSNKCRELENEINTIKREMGLVKKNSTNGNAAAQNPPVIKQKMQPRAEHPIVTQPLVQENWTQYDQMINAKQQQQQQPPPHPIMRSNPYMSQYGPAVAYGVSRGPVPRTVYTVNPPIQQRVQQQTRVNQYNQVVDEFGVYFEDLTDESMSHDEAKNGNQIKTFEATMEMRNEVKESAEEPSMAKSVKPETSL